MLARAGLVAVIGAGVGLVGAVASSRLLAALLFGIGPRDPGTLSGVVLLMVTGTLSAAFLPALRASRVDLVRVLSNE